jgi:hypothetical protein
MSIKYIKIDIKAKTRYWLGHSDQSMANTTQFVVCSPNISPINIRGVSMKSSTLKANSYYPEKIWAPASEFAQCSNPHCCSRDDRQEQRGDCGL